MRKALVCFLILYVSLSIAAQGRCLILFGIGHPIFQHDDRYFSILSKGISKRVGDGSLVDSFKSGAELIAKLKSYSIKCGKLPDIIIISHSNEEGLYVSHNNGFYKSPNQFPAVKNKQFLFSVQNLESLVKTKKVLFADTSKIFLLGCRTSFGNNSLAQAIRKATGREVLGFDSKVDFYNVLEKGQHIKIEGIPSLKIFPSNLEGIIQLSLDSSEISISDLYDISSYVKKH